MNLKYLNILLIEDNPGDALVIKEYLIEAGFSYNSFILAKNLSQGLDELKKNKVDLILLDLGLPDCNNEETISKIMDFTKKIPIIILSGNDDEQVAIDAVNNGVQDYLIKGKFDSYSISRSIKYSFLRFEHELKLNELNDYKSKLFRIISHDLKGPMSAMYTFIDMILEDLEVMSKDALKDDLLSLEDISKSLLYLVENLFDWARLQMGAVKANPENLNIYNLINENVNICRLQAENKNITVSNYTEMDLCAYADVEMIRTVIRNLIFNAIKFTPNNGFIEIGAQKNNGFIQVNINDTGIGIADENIATLFDNNNKCLRQGTNNEKGSGFGLLLCKEFIEQNNGKIWLTSKINEGSTFFFTIPASK